MRQNAPQGHVNSHQGHIIKVTMQGANSSHQGHVSARSSGTYQQGHHGYASKVTKDICRKGRFKDM